MNIKKGDLVMLIYAKNKENIGIIGKVSEYVGEHTYPQTGAVINDGWEVNYYTPLRIAGIDRRDGAYFCGEASNYVTPARYLIPLRGEELPEESLQECKSLENEVTN